ncbi:MAG: hypothetical protein ACPG4X_19655 [Pikeienuella sp.]
MGGKSSTTSTSSPPAWAAPLFTTSATDALDIYNSGQGGNTYLGSTVAPLSDQTMYGINQMGAAGDAWDTSGSTRDLYAGIGGASAGPSYAENNLADMASGQYLQSGNPYYRERLDKNIADSNAMIRSAFSGMGRYGSEANQDAIADNTSNMLLAGLESDWNRNLGAMLTANQQMDTARNAGLDRSLSATDRLYGQDQQNFANRLQGAGAQIDAGSMLDNKSQQFIQDEINKFYALDNEDWNRLGMLQQAAAGAAGNYGTQQSTSRTRPGIGQIAGAAGSLFGGK